MNLGNHPYISPGHLPRLTFCINSQAVVKALGACKFEFIVGLGVSSVLLFMAGRNKVALMWVSGHQGISGMGL